MSEGKEIRILYMEDDAGVARLVEKRLHSAGYKVDCASDGEQGYIMYKNGFYDMLILDQTMPVYSGLEIIQKITTEGNLPPTIMLTSSGSEEIAVEALKLGASDYIVKDVEGGFLLLLPSVIDNVLRMKRLEEEKLGAEVEKDRLISELKAVNKKVQHQKEELEKINKKQVQLLEELRISNATKDKFFSIIAHDLLNPFSTIVSFVNLMRQNIAKYSKDEIQKLSQDLKENADNTLNLLENLLQWARSQTEKIELQPKVLALSDIVKDIINELTKTAELKNITIEIDLVKNGKVKADANMIKTVLRNLISNAIKFTNKSGEILVAAHNVNNKISITISDTGVGMSEQKIKKLFHIGTKVTTRGTASERGSGLGLI